MTALWVSRAALLMSAMIWAGTLLLGYLRIGPAELLFGIGIYSAIAIGLSAVACVIFRFAIPRNSN
jgi:hypothetical protein